MKTAYTIYGAAELGVPTIPFEEYVDEDQLEEGMAYSIGVLEFGSLEDSKVCYTKEQQVEHITKLKRLHGVDAEILIQGYAVGDVYCVFEMSQLSIRVEGDITEDEAEILKDWKDILLKDFNYTRGLVGIVVKDGKGKMLLKSIH